MGPDADVIAKVWERTILKPFQRIPGGSVRLSIRKDRTCAFKWGMTPIFHNWHLWRPPQPPQNHTVQNPRLQTPAKRVSVEPSGWLRDSERPAGPLQFFAPGGDGQELGGRAQHRAGADAGAADPAQSFPGGRRAHRGPEAGGWGRGRGEPGVSRQRREPRGARRVPGDGVWAPRGPPVPSLGAAAQPARAQRPRPTFDAGHGGDVAPASGTRGGGGGLETVDAQRRRPDNTRKCATQHFRRRLTLARGRGGRGGRAGLGTVGPGPFLLSCAVVGLSLSKAFRPRLGSGAVETPASSRSPQRASRNLPHPLRRKNATGSRPLGTRGVMPLGESFSVLQRAPSSFPPPSCNKGAVRPVGWPAIGSSLSDTEPGFW